jgi:hypothetical protein
MVVAAVMTGIVVSALLAICSAPLMNALELDALDWSVSHLT